MAAGQCPLTFTTAGARSLTATYAGDANFNGSTSATKAHQVNAAATHFTFSIPNPFAAGTASGVAVTAKDAYGNTATGYRGTVHFTTSDTRATLPANYTFTAGDAGTHTFSSALKPALVLKTVGSQWVRATDTVTTSITGSQTVTVTAGVARTLVVSNIPNPFGAGTASGVAVTAKDAYGNTATGYRGTVHFTTSDTRATLPANYTFTAGDAGTHTFSSALKPALVLKTVGSQWVRATDTVTTSITGSQTVTVRAGVACTYHPITPVRLVDSRIGNGLSHHLIANTPATFKVAGRGGIPANATAVTGNVTVVNATKGGALHIGPSPLSNPPTSTINFSARQVLSNGLTGSLGSGGTLSVTYLASSGSSTDVVFDVTGYFAPDTTGATYHALAPGRVLDSRPSTTSHKNIGLAGKFANKSVRTFTVAGVKALGWSSALVPAGATAVTGNLTVTGATTNGYVAIGPTMTSTPKTSTLNVMAGQNRANGVTVALKAGKLSAVWVGKPGSSVDVIFDVTGYFTAGTGGLRYYPISPVRDLDSTTGKGLSGSFATKTARTLTVGGLGGVPTDAAGISGNLTLLKPGSAGYGFIAPSIVGAPASSTLNSTTGLTVANGFDVALKSGKLSIVWMGTSGSHANFSLDVTGYWK